MTRSEHPKRMAPDLEQLVNDVIAVTGADRPVLFEEDAPVLDSSTLSQAQEQGVYFIGLIGGKEVGKSSLVNALVGKTIAQASSFGEGTQIVTAYCHQAQKASVRELLEREVGDAFNIVTHEMPRLMRQVLLDLPDMDSHWEHHVLITRRMLRHMLFPLWVQSVEKYADLQPQQLLAKVAAGNAAQNFIFCLNKVDQLAEVEGPEAAHELRDDYAQRLQRVLQMSDPPRVYLLSAVYSDRYDLPHLRELLGTQKSLNDVERGKEAASRQRQNTIWGWLQRQNLTQRAESIARLQEDAEELVGQRLGAPIVERSIPGMLDDPSHRLAILDECLKHRCMRWPFVNIIQGLAAPITAIFRKRLSSRQEAALSGPEALVDLYLTIDGQDLATAIQSTFAQLQQGHPAVSGLYAKHKLWEARPASQAAAELARALAQTITRQRAIVTRRACGRDGPISALWRLLLTVGAIIWFPILQPILEALLAPSATASLKQIAYSVVSALSVTFLLKTLTFLVMWFVVIWLLVRWNTQRRIEKQLSRWKVADPADPALSLPGQTMEWASGLVDPVREAREKMDALARRAEELGSKVQDAQAA